MRSKELQTKKVRTGSGALVTIREAMLACQANRKALVLDISKATLASVDMESVMSSLLVGRKSFGVGIICSAEQQAWVRALSAKFAQLGIVIGDFTDPEQAKAHTLRERLLSLLDEACYFSASKVRRVKSSKA